MRVVNALVLILCLLGARSCPGPALRISGVAGVERSFNHKYSGNNLHANYWDNVTVFCSSDDSKNLRIKLDDGRSYGELAVVNESTVQLSVELPAIGEYDYTCTHVETDCAAKLRVLVMPVITLVSPNVHQKSLRSSEVFDYFVPINEDYELFCYGTPELKIIDGIDIETISVNETTVKAEMLQETEYSERAFFCAHTASRVTTRNVEILFDYVPAATNFWCKENEWQIDCSWTVKSKYTTFTLFYIDKAGNSMRIYEDFSGSKNTRRCEWNLKDFSKHNLLVSENLDLVIQACNPVYCSNETLVINRKAIIKTGPPEDLQLSRKTSQSAIVTWRGPSEPYYYEMPVEYRLSYRLPGIKLNGSSSQFTCDHQALRYLEQCEGGLKLPCPGAFYEVEVFCKFRNTPRTNAYWSDPARITFWTEPRNSSLGVDPACYKEPELIDNKYVAVYEVKKFEKSFLKEGSVLRGKVKTMEQKNDEIKRLCRGLGLEDCENFVLRVL